MMQIGGTATDFRFCAPVGRAKPEIGFKRRINLALYLTSMIATCGVVLNLVRGAMANKKSSKHARQYRAGGFGVKSLLPELQKAEALMIRKKWREAYQVLENLRQTYPTNVDVLTHLVNVCLELNDIPGYTQACERLLKVDPRNSDAAYGLAGGYLSCMHPLLALQAFHHALDRFPNHEKAKEARTFVAELEANMEEELKGMGLAGEEGRAIALLHEQGQAYLERGAYAQARQVEEEVLRLKPDFMSAFNNLCLIHYAEGDMDGAIAIAQQVLEQQPDNIHALSNLVRFYYLKGEREQAQQYGERLKTSQTEGWDRWTKKVEGLSYLGDDAGILEIYEQAKDADDLNITSALFHHLVAVAMERSGQSKQAKEAWKRALKRSPGFNLAQANLDDLQQPVGQRHAPWAFSLNSWINQNDVEELLAIIKSNTNADDEKLSQATQDYLNDKPYVARLIPVLLDRGDPVGREFAVRLAGFVNTPETLAALRDFALSQSGPDALRHQAAIKASEAGLLPSETIRMWLQGEWREISLIAYEFYDEPPHKHPRKVQNWLRDALSLLRQRNVKAAEQAEKLLKQALDVEPDAPDLLNNLAAAYEVQGRSEESQALVRQIVDQYPDYVYARASLAKLNILNGDLEAAEALLKPLLSCKRFHVDDFGVFSSAYIQLLMAKHQPDAAKAWLHMWEQVNPAQPELLYWQTQLKSPDMLKTLSKLFKGT
jgi:tetratricopeptide (TPR) repeat protein